MKHKQCLTHMIRKWRTYHFFPTIKWLIINYKAISVCQKHVWGWVHTFEMDRDHDFPQPENLAWPASLHGISLLWDHLSWSRPRTQPTSSTTHMYQSHQMLPWLWWDYDTSEGHKRQIRIHLRAKRVSYPNFMTFFDEKLKKVKSFCLVTLPHLSKIIRGCINAVHVIKTWFPIHDLKQLRSTLCKEHTSKLE